MVSALWGGCDDGVDGPSYVGGHERGMSGILQSMYGRSYPAE